MAGQAPAGTGLFGPGWPLVALFAPFPLWWLLGLSHVIFLILAMPMAFELARRRPLFVPHGFGLWLLFLAWMSAGILVLWAYAPGTVAGGSIARLVPFGYRALWYLAITIVCLYVLNLSERELPTLRVVRLLGWMFVVTTIGGLAGLVIPDVSFPSLVELILPVPDGSFVYALVHPSLSSQSDFLGFVQPRPTAPFAYANAWGNNLGTYLPFFVWAWFGRDAGWRRRVAPFLLVLALVAVVYSLNRGLWGGLTVAALLVAIRLAVSGRLWVLGALSVTVLVATVAFLFTPLYDTAALRLATPHSNDRRATVAETVIETTAEGSPLVGYGTNREVQGNFASIAGGDTPECHQCAAPPLGTQGFVWRLIFTTGFVGTFLYLGFMAVQFARHFRSPDTVAVVATVSIAVSLVFFLVYDSLESPLFTLMIAIGLAARRFLPEVRRPWEPLRE
jgi:hypothetical protein